MDIRDMDFGNILRSLRREANIGQKELAMHLNVSISTVSNYENSVHYPDLETLCKLADYFKVSIDYLMGRTQYRHPLDQLNTRFSDGSNLSDLVNTIVVLKAPTQNTIRDFVDYMASRESAALPAK